ncbi:J domain-containing protein [Phenylobacterium deserti]|uniref:Molecular chaperone DnaJ n=1 Tax=Phenylobacterium deserti TaxID=1914756 RepID=A0A328ATH5_9CAUL|nr:DnaJ domain-containing protein [Phenylobacterium deserti]RAK57907.1 molecular chaperone DnaJ [Phenylobacterium deserti]
MAARSLDMTLKDARKLLRVAAHASPAEVRRAFREAAKQAHPDRAGGDAERFRRVVAAYHLLQDAPVARDPFFQPPAPAAPRLGVLAIGPKLALHGGAVEHRLADGRTIRINLPAGLRSGDAVRAGDAELAVQVQGDGDMLVRGDDLWMTVKVAPRMLAEGGRLAVETPLGRRIVWVTKKAGERGLVRLVGQGLPARGRHAQGHLFVRLAPKTAGETQSAARTLLRRFAAAWAA